VLVDDRHIQRVGVGDAPDADRVVDLPGSSIVPGFVDAHVHLTGTGISLANADVERAADGQALLEIARKRAIVGHGPVILSGFDESTWGNHDLPSLERLDGVTERPLVIRRTDGHVALANSTAIRGAGLEIEEGLELDAEGRPTGRVVAGANEALWRWAVGGLTELEIQDLQLQAAALAASRGLTSVHEMAMPSDAGWRDVDVLLGHLDKLPVDTEAYVASTDVAQVMDLGLATIGGDLAADGSIGARTAALSDPYADRSDPGALYYDDDELARFFHAGHNAGMQVGMHAIGDGAIDQVLRTWERVYQALDSRERRHFRARRHRVEHFEVASPRHVERAAILGLAVSVQPAFDRRWGHPGDLYDQALGWERAKTMNPFRTVLERGVVLGAGSDAPVTPFDPWGAVAAMEQHHEPTQRLSRLEAFRVHTAGSARLAHQEEKKGQLEPGFHADLAVYDDDPFEVEDVRDLRPILTLSLGREVFSA
jgi:predicted amidohydrolase YtcJ